MNSHPIEFLFARQLNLRGGMNDQQKWLPLFILAALLALTCLSSCAALPGFSAAAQTPEAGGLLYSDDFSNKNSGWDAWSTRASAATYEQGGLRIRVNQPDYDYWSRPGKRFADVLLEVDAVRLGGPDANDFGMICRYVDTNQFYAFLIGSDGYAGIVRVKDGNYQVISGERFIVSPAVRKGNERNQIRAECMGPRLRLWVNGELVAQTEDLTFSEGEIGLIAGSYHEPGVDVLFDNFHARVPNP